jgi:two-component system sensor histidine kinase BaeS
MANDPAPRGAWRRLDTLRVKLFLVIAGANVVLVMAAYLIHSWSFDQGLVEYLNRADEARLTPLVTRLAEGYRENRGWQWLIDDRQRWQDLLREAGFARPSRRGPDADPVESAASAGTASPPPFPMTIDPRMLLLDADGEVLLGPAERTGQAVLKPIVVDEVTAGFLGYLPRLQMVASLERVFLAQQTNKFAAIALGLLAAVLLNAALIARWLSRRLDVLGTGAAAVARGDYGVRLAVHGHDELARLAADFNHMATSLQAAREARQQWIADIAHELRTPLATLRAEIEALQDGVRRPDAANLGSLWQEVGRLTRLVEDLRLLSLSDMGALNHHFEPLDLGRLVSDHLDDHPASLQLQAELPLGLCVRADGDRLNQVLSNLLNNTLRYTEPPVVLRVSLQRDGDAARLVWEDSAPGVPAEALPRLTERLYRVDASRARASGGSGLGLAIVRAIVEGHGGRMAASISPLGGLRWDLWLPLMDEAPKHHG